MTQAVVNPSIDLGASSAPYVSHRTTDWKFSAMFGL